MKYLKELRQSLKNARQGLVHVFKTQSNFRFQVYATVVLLVLSFFLSLKAWEYIVIILLAVWVMVMEIINTVIEKFNDLLKPRFNHYSGLVKDIMAGAVLLTGLGAAVVGLIILLPHLVALTK
ncbi:MAG: diacylglycerol kinase [Candidatus Magasanikbacteria bacterium CG10_big_fil_rev_8_21_14_0_10_40_10]|uniref:Diacylglycerol kinase n=1 Tax=Candidatus Magasanikbacteria bacterium CG10_big_fil_rev_8_21_14_0_10_40_10 TaxID=1974648 RepID=A0A2M6W397_9BACT|nr:MAG: diacylglycerol kinase [Candidatus Magasanikbacteria bacterium CG10_big_fil_rev_8_21_14_0_10_40_10]